MKKTLPSLTIVIISTFITFFISSCSESTVQREFKLVERWSSRWCADSTHENIDKCEFSQNMKDLGIAVTALVGESMPIFEIDAGMATEACMAEDENAIWDLNQFLAEGAKLMDRDARQYTYYARTEPMNSENGYHLVTCYYQNVILEAPESLFNSLEYAD